MPTVTWTALHGSLLARAFDKVLGHPQPGAVAFARCLTKEVVQQLAMDSAFDLDSWKVFRVAAVRSAERTITADRAVELRESKGDALLLLVDTVRAGAGMDGIYSAAREVDEATLFREARRLALATITKRHSTATRRYAEDALKAAIRTSGGRDALPPWTSFDFLCRIAAGEQSPGTYTHVLGLWPIRDSAESNHADDLRDARKFVDVLLGPAAASLAPAARIDALRLDGDSEQQRASLEHFLHEVDAKPLRTALEELAKPNQRHLWVGSLRTEGPALSIKSIELTPWRNAHGKIHRWSGLVDDGDVNDPPALILSADADQPGATLEVRWKVDPGDLERNAVDYRVQVVTGNLNEELAYKDVPHSARKTGEKWRFSGDDFALDEDAQVAAKVVVSVVGDEKVERRESEEFFIRFGDGPDPQTGGIGVRVRAFSEGVAALRSRDVVSEIAEAPQVAAGGRSYVTLRTPVEGRRRRSYRVLRSALVAEVERDWSAREGCVGRWVLKVRGSGEWARGPDFSPMDSSGAEWDRVEKASRRVAARFATTCGGVAQIYDERSKAHDIVKFYLRAWLALLRSGDPACAICNTVEVQSLSGRTIGLIVLPAHPLRMAWHAAYDNLVLHAAFEQSVRHSDLLRELAGLDGAMFPAFLPNPHGGAFVFADTLGFHAVGMVPDDDREPKAAVAMLARAVGGSDAADSAPSVGMQSAAVLGSEVVKYLDCHDTARLLRIHALRAGDGMTVARSLGTVQEHYQDGEEIEDDTDQLNTTAPVFSLDLYPSVAQQGITGRFIAEAREKRRSGAGVLAEQDRWMLQSVSLPGGVNQPRLRWARKDQQDPNTAAHVAIAFDTFESRVSPDPAVSRTARPLHAFGLLSFYERQYASLPAPQWVSAAPPGHGGEKHPSSRTHTDTLLRLQHAIQQAVSSHLGITGFPVLRTEISVEMADSLDKLHRLCDWVVTLDRNAGVEYFDSPRDNPTVYDAYMIDCVPERDDLGCLQLITSTANLDEVRNLLDRALDQMGLSRSRRNAKFLIAHLKALSGRLAIRLTGHRAVTSELIAMALSHANCRLAPASDDCWVSLEHGFFIPIDDVCDLLPPLSVAGDQDDEESHRGRPDLIYVSLSAPRRKVLTFSFIEVKYRRHLRTARSVEVLDSIRKQTHSVCERWFQWYDRDVCSAFRALRRAKLARVLRFYADKAHRHALPNQRYEALVSEIDRMIERGAEYKFAPEHAETRGWVFCPEYAGDSPLQISPDEWDTRIFLFGPGRLPDSDFGDGVPFRPPPAPQQSTSRRTPEHEGESSATAGSENTEATREERRASASTAAESSEPSVSFGTDARTNRDVRWPLKVQGNPHLLIAGLPGMGKTTCLLNLCRQMAASQVRPIVFSYHQDIDEKLAESVSDVRFVDFDGLGFNPLQVIPGASRLAHLDVAADIRDIFMAIYPELGDIQGERLRTAVKDSFAEAGWGPNGAPEGTSEPVFARFVEILRSDAKPDKGLRTLRARLNELDDYGFFQVHQSHHSLWDHEQPTVIRVHTTQNENLQRAFASLVFYGLYKDMFRRGTQDRITHALIFDEAHRAARLRLIPTMAKECRKYGISLVLASQEARDFHVSVFSAIANYLVLRLTATDARFLVRNVSSSQQERALIDRIKQMERFKGLFFVEGKTRPHSVNLSS